MKYSSTPTRGKPGWWEGSIFTPEFEHMNHVHRIDHDNGDTTIVWDDPWSGYQTTTFTGLKKSHADRITQMMQHLDDAVQRQVMHRLENKS